MTKHRSLTALTLVLALLFTLVPSALAAAPSLSYTMSGNSAALTLQNLGQESIYGAQVELTIPGSYDTASFAPSSQSAYAPPCHRTELEDATVVTLYLTSQTPLNQGAALPLGTLTLPRSFTMPTTAQVILLDRDLKALESVQSVSVARASSGGSSGGGGGGGGGGGLPASASYAVTLAATQHGTLTADADQAKAGSQVSVTAKAERGYTLDTFTVTPVQGSKVTVENKGGGQYTFIMPTCEVRVAATFVFTGYLAESGLPFTDVARDAWYYGAVSYVYDKGMMNGTAQTTFDPQLTTSRAMLVTILYRLTGQPEAPLAAYPDVPLGQYYATAVGWASQNRIVVGYETGLFQPDSPVTREQMATILYRYAAAMGYDVTARGDVSTFTDAAAISPYAADAMSWAVGAGLLSGMGDGTVAPGGQATRAQVATILQRFCQNIAK